MNENYLWDKTGRDPEIEKLESELAAFRPGTTAPPALRIDADLLEKPTSSSRIWIRPALSFGIVGAACIAAIVFAPGIIQSVRVNYPGQTEKTAPVLIAKNDDEPKMARSDNQGTATKGEVTLEPEKITRAPKIKSSESYRLPHKIVRRIDRMPGKPRRNKKQEKLKLTPEEKHAFDQLMLGLSITSANLKIVNDKVQGTRESRKE